MPNITTIYDLQTNDAPTTRRAQLLQMVTQRLENADFRLPFLENAQDANIIQFLNETLTQEQIKMIMESISRQEYNIEIIKIILNTVPNEFLTDFFNLRGRVDSAAFQGFLNFLLYCSVGIGDFATTQSVINEILLEILEPADNNAIEAEALVQESEQTRDAALAANERRAAGFAGAMGRIWVSSSWRTLLGRSLAVTGIGLAFFIGQPFYSEILTSLGGAVGATRLLEAVAQTNNSNAVVPHRSSQAAGVTTEAVFTAFASAFSVLKTFLFGER
jgi:hypothetical protein